MKRSAINSLLTFDYIKTEPENKYFERKSAQIRPSDLAPLISAFANADGGTIVIGISDSTRNFEGINSCGEEKINDFINAPKDYCRPMPKYQEEFLEIKNEQGKEDRLLLLHITSCTEKIIRTSNDKTFLRIGDKTKEMLGENLRNLEYSKDARHFEDEICPNACLEDLDEELLEKYKERIGAAVISTHQVLSSRGFITNKDGKEYLTNAAALLFAKNIMQFHPNCRIRFLRFDRTEMQVGSSINILKDKSIDQPILRLLEETITFITSQLREFTVLLPETSKFSEVPEYPNFAWIEGIVNAVVHRDYSMTGAYIKVSMFDDRLEIESPGQLPNIITLENICYTRYSRNPKISRVLTELGWVQELNEGVKRIFNDMEKSYLDAPVFRNKDNSVLLVLYNNISTRSHRKENNIDPETWAQLDSLEQKIIAYLINHGPSERAKLSDHIGKSIPTIILRINHLIKLGLVIAKGAQRNPNRTYEVVQAEKPKT